MATEQEKQDFLNNVAAPHIVKFYEVAIHRREFVSQYEVIGFEHNQYENSVLSKTENHPLNKIEETYDTAFIQNLLMGGNI